MKQFWKKGIVALLTIAIFLAPISAGVGVNKTEAQTPVDILKISTTVTEAKLNNPIVIKAELNKLPSENLPIVIEQIVTFHSSYSGTSTEEYDFIKADPPADPTKKNTCKISYRYTTNVGWNGNKDCSIWFNSNIAGTFNITASTSLPNGTTFTTKPISINISTDGTEPPAPDKQTETLNKGTKAAYNMSCGTGVWFLGGGSLGGCIAGILYVLWEASAWVARLAGGFLDFFVYYSTNDASYRNLFIEKGWGAIRDIANIFFIIALLYVAIKTILGLNVTDNKKLVGAVIIIALIINFSLFTTKVVIDGSNILAKVFYNNITPTKKGGTDVVSSTDVVSGNEGEKSISVGMINKYNPQEIISEDSYKENGPGMFIFTTIILLIITLYTAYIFFSVAVLFVARVVSLWISMIFSPLAFVSYAVPFEIPGFGHKEWWDELLKNAFLAPIFIFFLYIIVLFLDIGKNITYNTTSTDPLQKIMGVVIPFVILFFLLKMAKDIAIKYSGEMGKAVMTGAKMLGGAALGAATGGAAMLGRTAIGGGGGWAVNKLASGAEKIGLGRTANKLRDVSDFARKSSFDARRVKIAGQSMSSVTGMKVGEGQKGGWTEMKKQQMEKRQKRAEELENRGTGKEKKEKDKAEIELKDKTLEILDPAIFGTELGGLSAKAAIEVVDKKMDKARIDLNDAKNANDIVGIATAKANLDAAKIERESIRNLGSIASGGTGSIKDLELNVRRAKDKLQIKGEEITTTYAKTISGGTSKIVNQIFRLGAYSRAGADEAARKIRTGTKLDSGEKPH